MARRTKAGGKRRAGRSGVRCTAAALAAASGVVGLSKQLLAANGADTWTGATNAWSSIGNWNGANTPPNSGDSLVFGAAGAGGLNLNDDLTAGNFSVAGITFNSGAAAFVIGNGTTTANAGNAFVLAGSITNNTASTLETINNPFSIAGTQTFTTTNSGAITTLNGNISGGGAIVVAGAGTLTLNSASSTYTGGTTISSGTLAISANTDNITVGGLIGKGQAGTGAITLAGGTLSVNGSPTILYTIAAATGSTSTIFANNTSPTLNGPLTGNGTINFGQTPSGTAISTSGTTTFQGDLSGFTGTINYNDVTNGQQVSLQNISTNLSNAILVLTGVSTSPNRGFAANVSSTVQIGALSGTGGTLGYVFGGSASATYQVGALNTSTTFAGLIADNASGAATSLTKVGSGTLALSNVSNLYTGTTTVNAGTLQASGSSGTPFGTGNVTLNAGTLSLAPVASGAAALTGASAATGTTFSYAGGATLQLIKNGASLSYTVGNASPTVSVLTRSNHGTLTLNPTAVANLGAASGFEDFVVKGLTSAANKNGAGNGTGIYDASVVDQVRTGNSGVGGFVKYDATASNGFDDAASGTTSYTTHSGSSFTTSANEIADVTTANTITDSGNHAYAIRFGPLATTLSGTVTINGGAAGATNSGIGGIILNPTATASTISGGTALDFGSSEAAIYVGSGSGGGAISTAITGTGGLTKFGPGTLSISSTGNTFSGGISVNQGILNVNSDVSLGNTSQNLVFNGGTLQFGASFNPSTSRATTLNAAGGTVDTQSNNNTIGSTISGTGGLTKIGSGNLTLSNTASSFTGNVVVSAGTLTITSGATSTANALGANTAGKSITIASGTMLVTTTTDAIDYLSSVGNNLGFIIQGTWNNNPSNTAGTGFQRVDNLTLQGATINDDGQVGSSFGGILAANIVNVSGSAASTYNQAGNGSGLGLGTTTTFNIADVTGDAAADFIVNGLMRNTAVSTTASMVKVGVGTMVLNVAGTYSGTTTVSAGTLRANNSSGTSATGSGNVTVAAGFTNYTGGTLGGNGTISGNVSLAAGSAVRLGGIIAAGADTLTTGTLTTGNETWNAGAVYNWKVKDLGNSTSARGSGNVGGTTATWDALKMNGLTLNALGGSSGNSAIPSFTIKLSDLTTLSPTIGGNYSWVIGNSTTAVIAPAGYAIGTGAFSNLLASGNTSAGFAGIAPAFVLDTSGLTFANAATTSANAFTLELISNGGGDNLVLDYTAAPEPGSALLIVAGAAPLMLRRRRRHVMADGSPS